MRCNALHMFVFCLNAVLAVRLKIKKSNSSRDVILDQYTDSTVRPASASSQQPRSARRASRPPPKIIRIWHWVSDFERVAMQSAGGNAAAAPTIGDNDDEQAMNRMAEDTLTIFGNPSMSEVINMANEIALGKDVILTFLEQIFKVIVEEMIPPLHLFDRIKVFAPQEQGSLSEEWTSHNSTPVFLDDAIAPLGAGPLTWFAFPAGFRGQNKPSHLNLHVDVLGLRTFSVHADGTDTVKLIKTAVCIMAGGNLSVNKLAVSKLHADGNQYLDDTPLSAMDLDPEGTSVIQMSILMTAGQEPLKKVPSVLEELQEFANTAEIAIIKAAMPALQLILPCELQFLYSDFLFESGRREMYSSGVARLARLLWEDEHSAHIMGLVYYTAMLFSETDPRKSLDERTIRVLNTHFIRSEEADAR